MTAGGIPERVAMLEQQVAAIQATIALLEPRLALIETWSAERGPGQSPIGEHPGWDPLPLGQAPAGR